MIILSIMGNLLSALLLQMALQVYVHERQLGSGIILFILLFFEVAFLLTRGFYFNLLSFPSSWFLPFLLGSFLFATILVFVGSLMAIAIGSKKRSQINQAKEKLGLMDAHNSVEDALSELARGIS